MRWGCVLCAVVLCFAASELTGQDDEFHRLTEQANALEHSGQYAQAFALYREALHMAEGRGKRDKDVIGSLNGLAVASIGLGRLPEAERYYGRILALAESAGLNHGPDYAVLLYNLGALRLEEGRVQDAEKLIR